MRCSSLWGASLMLAAIGCGAGNLDYGRWDGTSTFSAGPALNVQWTKTLAPEHGGAYVPVERAGAAIDPLYGRVYVGSSDHTLWAFTLEGQPIYHRTTDASIEAPPALDAKRNELYVATASGKIHALRASDGSERFVADVGGAISQAGVLSTDALYVVTDADGVFAISRADGATLWRYQRDARSGLKVAGHAGLLSSDQRLITGFSDGMVVALAKGDGRVLWSVDTTLDFADPAQAEQGFVDVDTTPVQVDELVYVASFLGGFYALRVKDGVAQYRNPELTGITSMASDQRALVMVSAERGVECVDLPNLAGRWRRRSGFRGAPNAVRIQDRTAYVTDSRGALLALTIGEGLEIGRLQTEHGFTGTPNFVDGRGAILGNAGVLYAFRY